MSESTCEEDGLNSMSGGGVGLWGGQMTGGEGGGKRKGVKNFY